MVYIGLMLSSVPADSPVPATLQRLCGSAEYRPVPNFWFFVQWCASQKWNFEAFTQSPYNVATIEQHIITNNTAVTKLNSST